MPPNEDLIEVPMQIREARINKDSVDVEARTVPFTWTTGATVRRNDFFGNYDEMLETKPKNVRMDRFKSGRAPFIAAHDSRNLDSVIGVITKASLTEGVGDGVARLSKRSDVDEKLQDISDGILGNVSVGYFVHAITVEKREGDVDLIRVTDWEPAEASLVPIGADPGAFIHREGETTSACIVTRSAGAFNQKEEGNMNEIKTETKETPEEVRDAPAQRELPIQENREVEKPDIQAMIEAAQKKDRERSSEIRALGKTFHMEGEFTENLVNEGVALDQARAAIMKVLADRQENNSISSFTGGEPSLKPDEKRNAMVEALVARCSRQEPSETARSFMRYRFSEMAAECLRDSGARIEARDPWEIIKRSMTSSDFPLLLADAANKMFGPTYQKASPTFRSIAQQKTFTDFKAHKYLGLGDFPNLLQIYENGEIELGTISEQQESVYAYAYGRRLPLTRVALVNDDMGAFDDLISKAAERAAQFENDTFYAMLLSNAGLGPTMRDTLTLFHATHGNVAGAGAAISVTTLSAGRQAMRNQTSVDSLKLNIVPTVLLCGPAYETLAEQILAPLVPAQAANVNPFSGKLQPIADANFTGNQWYLVAATSGLIWGYLQDSPGPRISTKDTWEIQGIEFKLELDFGCGAIDWRGVYRNAGA